MLVFPPPVSAFGDLLRVAIERRFDSQKAFAEAVKINAASVSFYVGGTRPPPMDADLERWADVLELAGEDRHRFIDEAHLARADEHVQRLVQKLRATNAELEARVENLRQRVADLIEKRP